MLFTWREKKTVEHWSNIEGRKMWILDLVFEGLDEASDERGAVGA